jgi:hypothetical protein
MRLAVLAALAALAACLLTPTLEARPFAAVERARSAEAGVSPRSVTFVSTQVGWVLGTVGCGARSACPVLLKTTDRGSSWAAQALPAGLRSLIAAAAIGRSDVPAGELNVRFADASDGWIFGGLLGLGNSRPFLWVTHDGGASWHPVSIPWLGKQSSILDLEASAGRAQLLASNDAGRLTIASAAAHSDAWRITTGVALGNPAGGGLQSGAFTLTGSGGWLVEGNDRGTTGSARLATSGRWVAWTPPCAALGGSFAVPAAANARSLVAVCVIGGFASPMPKAAPPGATLGSSWLYGSSNGGASFAPLARLGGLGSSFGPAIASPQPGVILLGRSVGADQGLAASFDGGKRWSVVARGLVDFLGFTTSRQGIAILEPPSGAARLELSLDGGHSWATLQL